jgi:prepilin-type processing-associated H-X9-DG protein
LRQLGLAMNAYHGVHGMFPPGYMITQKYWSSNRMTGFVFLLPYIEQRALFDSINMDLVHVDSSEAPLIENRTARHTRVETFLCPSDGEPNHLVSYRFNFGRLASGRATPYDGPFSIGITPSQATITDGLSRTAFLSERVGGGFAATIDPRRDIRYYSSWTGTPTYVSDDALIADCLAAPVADWSHTAGRYWMYNGPNDTDYNHSGPPNDRRPSCGIADAGLYPPRSFHVGGVNLLLGDGHVERIADSIDMRAWRALGTFDLGD